LNRGNRRTQLVRGVRHEVAPHRQHPTDRRHVAEHANEAAAGSLFERLSRRSQSTARLRSRSRSPRFLPSWRPASTNARMARRRSPRERGLLQFVDPCEGWSLRRGSRGLRAPRDRARARLPPCRPRSREVGRAPPRAHQSSLSAAAQAT
jgi:hypothetical protein